MRKAIEYLEKYLKIAIEIGYQAGEERAYENVSNAELLRGDFRKAIEYHEKLLKIPIEIGDRSGEGGGYGNLGNMLTFHCVTSKKPLRIMKNS